MRPLPRLALLSIIATPIAHASSYTFSFSGQDPELQSLGVYQPYSENFTADTSQIVRPTADNGFNCADGSCFTVPGGEGYLSFTRDGQIQESTDIGLTPDETLYLFTNSSETTPLTLFTGSNLNPTIATGTFYASIFFYNQSFSPQGPITIVDPPSIGSSPVPEPSTLALLGTGALGLAGTIRRRFVA